MIKILIVEDDKQFRLMLSQMLTRAGYLVMEAESGSEGLEKFKKSPPSIMILDMMTPGQDGLEVLSELKKDFPELKVIAISGGLKGDTSWLEPLAFSLGVKAFMHKPFKKEELLNTVHKVLYDNDISL